MGSITYHGEGSFLGRGTRSSVQPDNERDGFVGEALAHAASEGIVHACGAFRVVPVNVVVSAVGLIAESVPDLLFEELGGIDSGAEGYRE